MLTWFSSGDLYNLQLTRTLQQTTFFLQILRTSLFCVTYKHYKFTPIEERNGTSVFVINFISSMRNKQINKIDNLIEIKKIFNTTESREKSQDNQNK